MSIMYEVNNLIVVCIRGGEREFIWVTTAAEILNYPEEYTARVSDAYKRTHHMWVKQNVRGEKRNCWKKMCLRIKDKTLMNFMLRKDWEHVACDWHTISTPHFVSLLNFLPSFLFLIIRWFFTYLFPLDLFRMSRAFQKISFLC